MRLWARRLRRCCGSIRFRRWRPACCARSSSSTPASRTTRSICRRTTDDGWRGGEAPRLNELSGGAHAGQERVDLAGQLFGLLGEVGGRGENVAGGVAGFVGGRADATDIGGDFLGGLRRLRHIARDLGGRRTPLLARPNDLSGQSPGVLRSARACV